MRRFLTLLRSTCASLALLLVSNGALAVPTTGLVISELMFDPAGSDNNKQWIELYNGTGGTVDLSNYSLGWGRDDYLAGTMQLSGTILDGQTWVIGGSTSSTQNGLPTYDIVLDFAPNLRDGTHPGRTDGIALFDVVATSLTVASVPIHTVIYGTSSASTVLLDETGATGTADFLTDGGFTEGNSISFWGADDWRLTAAPTPGTPAPAIPEPNTATLLAFGLLLLCASRRLQFAE